MPLTHTEFFARVKRGEIARAYLFEGLEEYVKESALEALRRAILPQGLEPLNESVLTNPTASALVECAETLPVLADRRLVVARECALVTAEKAAANAQDAQRLASYLDALPETVCIVFYCKGLADGRKKLTQALCRKGAAVRFDPLGDAELVKWISSRLRAQGKTIAPAVALHLSFVSGRALAGLSQEIGKLAAYVGERQEITQEDVERVATRTAECTVFALADALVAGREAEAFRLLNALVEHGEGRIGALAMIARQYRNMLHAKLLNSAGAPQDQIAAKLGVPAFAVRKLLSQAQKESAAALREKLDLCVETDYAIKSGRLREEAGLSRAMLRLCAHANAAQGQQ